MVGALGFLTAVVCVPAGGGRASRIGGVALACVPRVSHTLGLALRHGRSARFPHRCGMRTIRRDPAGVGARVPLWGSNKGRLSEYVSLRPTREIAWLETSRGRGMAKLQLSALVPDSQGFSHRGIC